MVHGFTQNAACLRPLAEVVAETVAEAGASVSIALIDAPGHGSSNHDNADLVDAARLIVEAGGDGHYVGYSMGGRMLLHAALLFPDRFASLTLIGATAGIESPTDRAARAAADEQLAQRLEADGLGPFLDFWLGLALFTSLSTEAACRDERMRNRVAGLAGSLRMCGTGNQFPLWHLLDRIDLPVQVIAGTEDTKFSEIGMRMVEHLPNARFEHVAGGHAVHSEQPAAVAKLISEFVLRVAP
jgi:2-succinyl-6-hydroxy-2,4-cyclohexadiene-1-carboxylate synthase